MYVDFEVIDAISFRHYQGYEVILNMNASKVVPYRTDNTGDGNQVWNTHATRRTHMQRVTSSSDSSQYLDIEVLDAIAFRDKRGEEWVLSMPSVNSPNVYNSTTGTGSRLSTRRVHNEKIYTDPTDTTSPYMLVQRCDTMSFRNVRGQELIIRMASSDDGSGSGRASTYMTPADYDPTSDVAPPTNSDPSIYAFIAAGAAGVATGTDGDTDTVVACGPLWWPRGISKKSGPWYWYVPTQTPKTFSLYITPGHYIFDTNPSISSWEGTNATFTWEWLPGVLTQNLNYTETYFTPFDPFGWNSLDDAILYGYIGQDWGLIDYSDTRIDGTQSNGLSTSPCIPNVSGSPDIWQQAGIPAPALIPPVAPATKWQPGSISSKLAAQVANAWADAWNGTSDGFNGEMSGAAITLSPIYEYIHWPDNVDMGVTERIGAGNTPSTYAYPNSSFGVDIYDVRVNPPLTGGRVLGGLPGDFWNADGTAGPGVGVIDASLTDSYASSIAVAQLDPTKWDTSTPYEPKLKASTSS